MHCPFNSVCNWRVLQIPQSRPYPLLLTTTDMAIDYHWTQLLLTSLLKSYCNRNTPLPRKHHLLEWSLHKEAIHEYVQKYPQNIITEIHSFHENTSGKDEAFFNIHLFYMPLREQGETYINSTLVGFESVYSHSKMMLAKRSNTRKRSGTSVTY